MLAKLVLYFGQPCVLACDAKCEKAWGINNRPRLEYDPDDMAFLADGEVGIAPIDPGTYEGGQGKPQAPEQRLNKWCARECERCSKGKMGELIKPHDFVYRLYNQPWKHS